MSGYFTLHVLALLLTGLMLGAMVLFAFVVTPAIFRHLPRAEAGDLVAKMFPLYYKVMIAASVLAALSVWYRPAGVVLALVAVGFVVGFSVLLPRIEALRPGRLAGEAAATARFRRLHGMSSALNLVQMLALLAVFLRLAR